MNNEYIETIIVYNCLTNPEYFTTIEGSLDAEVFEDSDYQAAMRNRLEFFREHGRIPKTSELVLEKGQHAEINLKTVIVKIKSKEIEDIGSINEQFLYDKTLEYIKKRRYFLYIKEQVENFQRGKIDLDTSFKKCSEIVNVSFDIDMGTDFWKDIPKAVDEVVNNSEKISSGWKWIDEQMGGGWLKKGRALYVFQGASNIGKSIWLGNCVTNLVRQGKNVVLFTFEMSEAVYCSRLISDLSKIPIKNLSEQKDAIITQMEAIQENSNVGKLLIKEFPPDTISVGQLEAYLNRLVKSGIHIDAIVVDYLNLLRGNVGDNTYERIKSVVVGLRALTYKFSCPLITATQINRSSSSGTYGQTAPELDAVSESLAVAQTADAIISIYQEDGDAALGNMRVYVPKSRFGIKGMKTVMKIAYTTLSITENRYTAIATQRVDDVFAETP